MASNTNCISLHRQLTPVHVFFFKQPWLRLCVRCSLKMRNVKWRRRRGSRGRGSGVGGCTAIITVCRGNSEERNISRVVRVNAYGATGRWGGCKLSRVLILFSLFHLQLTFTPEWRFEISEKKGEISFIFSVCLFSINL